jgi:LuxR family maltose regulon positive regulatory protein
MGRPMAAPSPPQAARDLLLKVTPPRLPPHLVTRQAFRVLRTGVSGSAVVLVQAPAGFGKTSLLAQWRRDNIAQGDAVAWITAQPEDHAARFLQSLALAVRIASGRRAFGHLLMEAPPRDALEGVTAWLTEVAQLAVPVLLIVDETERLPVASRELLAYLLRNAPANLRCVVAARADCDLGLDDFSAYGQCTVIDAGQLRFRLEETLALVREHFDGRVTEDEAARLHEMTEGWPLGLQLALSMNDAAGRRFDQHGLDLQGGALREHFVAFMLRNLDAADLDFLTRVSIASELNAEFAQALSGDALAPQRLERLLRQTPLFMANVQTDWLRMHSLARGALLERFEALAQPERAALHARAADWLAAHDMLDKAARHALAAGRAGQAYDLAERSLYRSTIHHGRQGAVIEWLEQLPPAEVNLRPRLLLAVAWALSLSDRHDEAGAYVTRILSDPAAGEALRCECALILAGACNYADDPDGYTRLHDPWADAAPLKDPVLLQLHANRSAYRALLDGQPGVSRLCVQQAPHAAPYLDRWGECAIGHSYLWEGRVERAAQVLAPTLAAAEAALGPRSPFATMVAALLASAVWEQGRPEDARALMANRIDVLERHGMPEFVLLGYRTLVRVAVAEPAEQRALELLSALDAVGLARRLPRLRIVSLCEQVRLHARRFRAQTCRELCARLDALHGEHAHSHGPLWQRSIEPLRELAHAYLAISERQWRAALAPLERADAVARQVNQGRLHIELLGLRALALDRCGERVDALLREAADLAQSHGLRRVFVDAHPDLAELVQTHAGAAAGSAGTATPAMPAPAPVPAFERALASPLLTPKEREVLELLARRLSNKEIALAMQVGEPTIKWHLRNLFAKLDAGTRKHVVARARILGVLAGAS